MKQILYISILCVCLSCTTHNQAEILDLNETFPDEPISVVVDSATTETHEIDVQPGIIQNEQIRNHVMNKMFVADGIPTYLDSNKKDIPLENLSGLLGFDFTASTPKKIYFDESYIYTEPRFLMNHDLNNVIEEDIYIRNEYYILCDGTIDSNILYLGADKTKITESSDSTIVITKEFLNSKVCSFEIITYSVSKDESLEDAKVFNSDEEALEYINQENAE